MKGDAAIGKAIREFIEQDTGLFEEVTLRLELVKGGASFGWHEEIDNKVCAFITVCKGGTPYDKTHASAHGDTVEQALRAAGLMDNA